MKIKIIVLGLILVNLIGIRVFAASNEVEIVITIDKSIMLVNGVEKEIDPGRNTKAIIVSGRTLLPIRSIIEELGGSIEWNAEEKKVTIGLKNKSIELWIDNAKAFVNSEEKQLDVPPTIINSRTMIPLRFISENLGAEVTWDASTHQAKIIYGSFAGNNNLLINDQEISQDKYYVKNINGSDYIYVEKEQFGFAFKSPIKYLNDIYLYPKVNQENEDISITWQAVENNALDVKMRLNSPEIIVNGIPQDNSEAMPELKDGNLFIPINYFVAFFDMDIDVSGENALISIQFKDGISYEDLYGKWSDIDTSIFSVITDGIGAIKGSPSTAEGYNFNKDKTYSYVGFSNGTIFNGVIIQKGNYKVVGQTLILYNIIETVYKGDNLVLEYKDKLLEKPAYLYIANYNSEEKKIEIDLNWLTWHEV